MNEKIKIFLLSNKKTIIIFLLAFVVPIVATFWWWGAFNDVIIEKGVRGPYHFAYVDHEGDYARIPDHQLGVLNKLRAQKIEARAPIVVLEADPRYATRHERRAKVGYLIAPEIKSLKEGVLVGDVPQRAVIIASVRAQPLLAPGKVYTNLIRYLEKQNRSLRLPTVETYKETIFSVEMIDH